MCVRSEDINISGSLYRNKLKYAAFKRKHMTPGFKVSLEVSVWQANGLVSWVMFLLGPRNSNPRQGPFHFRAPSKILWRTIRGMAPWSHSAARLAELRVFMSR